MNFLSSLSHSITEILKNSLMFYFLPYILKLTLLIKNIFCMLILPLWQFFFSSSNNVDITLLNTKWYPIVFVQICYIIPKIVSIIQSCGLSCLEDEEFASLRCRQMSLATSSKKNINQIIFYSGVYVEQNDMVLVRRAAVKK